MSSNAHKVLIRQKNFETLTKNLFVKNKKSSNITQETKSWKKNLSLLQGKFISML